MTAKQTSLDSLTVLVTRPDAQQRALTEAIAERGGSSVSFPLLEIQPIEDEAARNSLRRQVENLDNYNLLIFVSTNAAQHGGDLIDSYWPQFPVGVQVLAVGPTTAAAVSAHLNCPVISSPTGMASEDLLQITELQEVAGKKIALFRGEGGRELLANTLRERGAQVDYFEVYRRRLIEYPERALVNEIGDHGVNVVTAFSAESLSRLLQLAEDQDARRQLVAIPLLVPSQRIADLATAEGFSSVYNANGATTEASITALQEIAAGADN